MKVNRSDSEVDVYNTAIQARLRPRVATIADAATITPTSDTADEYTVTALAQTALVDTPSGTPTNGQKLLIRVIDNGTARTLSWSSNYTAIDVSLPLTTVVSKYLYVGCIYNSTTSKWDVVAVGQQT